MADITMCFATECDKKETCYRYLAEPDRLQSYSDFSKYKEKKECEYYWRVDDEDN